ISTLSLHDALPIFRPHLDRALSLRRTFLRSVSRSASRNLSFGRVYLTQYSGVSSFEFLLAHVLKLSIAAGGIFFVNWSFLFLRVGIGLGVAALLYLSQRFWYRSLWRVTAHWGRLGLRRGPRLVYVVLLLLMLVTLIRVVII